MNEQYKCGSYYDDNNVLQDCTCSWCELEDYLINTLIGDLAEREFTARLITKRIRENYTPKSQRQAECEKYLDEFVKYVFKQPMNQGLWHEYAETFKKEQREHE